MVMLLFLRPVLDTVSGLRWGDYLGSPADSVEPKLAVNEVIGAQQIVSVTTGEIIGLTESTCVITHEVKSGMYLRGVHQTGLSGNFIGFELWYDIDINGDNTSIRENLFR